MHQEAHSCFNFSLLCLAGTKGPFLEDTVKSRVLTRVYNMEINCIIEILSYFFILPAKFDNFKDEKISDYKTVSDSQDKNLLDWKLLV